MSKLVLPQLILDGNEFLPKNGYSATVEQCVGGHSAFSISFLASATETYAGALMENAINFIGKRMSIGLDDGAMEYTGLITSVDLQKGTGAGGTLVVSGHGPSVLLANSVQCLSYEEGTPLSNVASDTLKDHSTDILKVKMGAGTNVALPYTVQYNESDLSFLQRLCRKYGLWLYHNGQDYCIGRSGSKQIEGTYGVDVTAFNLSTTLRGRGPEVSGHDWMGDTLLETPSSTASPTSGHPYFGQVKKESDFAFAKKGTYDYTIGQHEYSQQGGMDTALKVSALGAAAGMVTASGVSELVKLRVGDILSLEGINFTNASDRHIFGNYDITKIVHSFDHSGHYRNRFEAVPADTDHPPYSDGFAAPFCADQRGRVLDNADPDGLGRVKVQFPWQRMISQSTPWIKIATPYAGSGKGFYFVPEKDEEVLVGFEGGNPEKPYVLSAGFNTNAKSDFYDAENNIKAIKTRSGHLIELNDTDGEESITITDKNSNKIFLNTKDSSISITAPANLSLTADTIDIKAKNALTMTSEEATVSIKSKQDMDMESTDAKLRIVGKENVSMESTAAEVGITAKTTAKVDSSDAIAITASNEFKAHGGGKSKVSGGKVEINQG